NKDVVAMAEVTGLSEGKVGSANDRLVGTWKLVSASTTTSTGERSETPYGLKPVGFLTYTDEGRIAAMISHSGRSALFSGGGSLEEQAEAFKTFFGYAGRYTVSGDTVTHHVEISSIQNYVGRDLVRNVKFQGDRITLVTPPTPVNGKTLIFELIWERLRIGS
ncbi:MAG: lipocalin-like domain-containing protein, partial [Candidatus Sulfotelmatobacter sp.]